MHSAVGFLGQLTFSNIWIALIIVYFTMNSVKNIYIIIIITLIVYFLLWVYTSLIVDLPVAKLANDIITFITIMFGIILNVADYVLPPFATDVQRMIKTVNLIVIPFIGISSITAAALNCKQYWLNKYQLPLKNIISKRKFNSVNTKYSRLNMLSKPIKHDNYSTTIGKED